MVQLLQKFVIVQLQTTLYLCSHIPTFNNIITIKMKFLNLFTYIILVAVCFNQTACNSLAHETVMPENSIQSRVSGGGPIIILEDPGALPTYAVEAFNQTSSTGGCLSISHQLPANSEDVAIAYKPLDDSEATWSAILIEGAYTEDEGMVKFEYNLPCVNENTTYTFRITSIPNGEVEDINVGEAAHSCSVCY